MQDHIDASAETAPPAAPPVAPAPVKAAESATSSPGASHKWLKRLAWATGSILVLGAASWALVPPILKNQLEKLAGEQLGRQFTVGKIDFKPWSLELTLEGVALAKPAGAASGSAPQVQIQRVYLDASIQSVRRLAPVLDALQIDGLDVKLTHLGGGKYDIDDILARLNKPPEKPVDPKAAPPGFALFNVAIKGASLDFTDKAVGRTHELRALNLSVPFLSNLDTHREVKTEPQLAFKFNGSSFNSQAAATPFKDSRKTDAAIRLADLDLTPYLGYLPAGLPVRLASAVLDADLKLAFEQTPRVAVKLTGSVDAKGVAIQDAAKQDLLKFDSLKLVLDDVRPLEQVVKLSLVELTAPTLEIKRNASGPLNLMLQAGREADAKPPEPKPADAKTPAWQVEIAKAVLQGGGVNFHDQTTQPAVQLALKDVALQADGMAWPFTKPLQFKGSAALPDAANLQFEGNATDQAAQVNASLGNLQLGLAAPYLQTVLAPQLAGKLAAEVAVAWTPASLKVSAKQVAVSNLALVDKPAASSAKYGAGSGAAPVGALASLKALEIAGAEVDVTQRTVQVGKLTLVQPAMAIERDASQRWMFERWLKSSPSSSSPPTPAATQAVATPPAKAASGAEAKPWALSLKDVQLDGGQFQFTDKGVAKPVTVALLAVKVGMKDVALDGKKPFALNLSVKLQPAGGQPGQMDYKGTLGLAPLVAQGSLVATQIPVHAFESYFGDALNIELLRADAGFKGDVRFASGAGGATVKVTGDSVLEEFRAHTAVDVVTAAPAAPASTPQAAPNAGQAVASEGAVGLKISEELLTWKALSLRGLDVSLTPGAATQVTVAETVLTDFFARVKIDPTGRINLQDLVKSNAAAPAPATAASGSAPAVASPASGPQALINIGPVTLINGKVFFSDQFIKPNYSANLSELNGRLSAFSSSTGQGAAPQMADLELRGRAEGTAALEIGGKLNPLAKPLALDIKATVRDLELPPLSPYSVKYAGHAIERGKLSVDLAYLVLPNGQLDAKNKIILNQLKFGEKVEGAPASLPVRLAVALLADRNGVIDLDLPVSGSLNDPQFSLGPIIFKVIVNVIVKAITAPFSLLAAAFGGGGDELSQVAFAPGSAALSDEARQGLDKVAKALIERPGLKMTVIGTSSLQEELDGYKLERLKTLLQTEKRRALVVGGSLGGASTSAAGANAPANAASAPAATAAAQTVVSEAEIPGLVKEVYKRSDFPKPRVSAVAAKEPTQDEMRTALLANIVVTEDQMRELAVQRGVAVKDYLAGKQLPVGRLFLGSVKTGAGDVKALEAGGASSAAQAAAVGAPASAAGNAESKTEAKQPGAPAKWTPRAELNLATN